MRIIAGKYKGRILKTLKGKTVRPTADRVREAIFSVLGEKVEGTDVLDLYAGSGALGLEALSRGAGFVVFVEKNPRVAQLIRSNIDSLKVKEKTRVWKTDVIVALKNLELEKCAFDLVFLDPPYGKGHCEKTLSVLGNGKLLNHDAIVVVEHETGRKLQRNYGCLKICTFKTYGDTSISFYSNA